MEIFGIAAFALVSATLITLLRQYLPAYGAVCLTLCAVLLLGRILQLAHNARSLARANAVNAVCDMIEEAAR